MPIQIHNPKRYNMVQQFFVELWYLGLVIFSVVFVFSVSNTQYHVLCTYVIGVEIDTLKCYSNM